MALKKKYYALGLDEEEEKKGSSSSKSTTVKAAKTEKAKESAKETAKKAAAAKTAAELKSQAKAAAKKAAATAPVKTAADLKEQAKAAAANQEYFSFLRNYIEQGKAFAQQGPKSRQQLADSLLGGAIWDVNRGDVDSLDMNALREMQLRNQYYIGENRNAGTFDYPEYLTDKYITLTSDNYLTAQEQTALAALEASQKKDEEAKAANSYRVNSWQHWSDMQNRLGEMTEENAPYFYAYADYLTKGDFSKPFDMDEYDAMWNEMDDDAYWADMDAKQKAFDALDWATLTDKSAERTAYESQTPALQAQYDLISGEAASRKRIAELEALAMNNPQYSALSVYTEDPTGKDANFWDKAKATYVGNYEDIQYFINNPPAYAEQTGAKEYSVKVRDYLDKGYNYMTPDQVAVYNVLYNTDKAQAQAYLDALSPQLLASRAAVNQEYTETLSTNPWTAVPMWTAARVAGLMNAAAVIPQALEAFTGQDDPNSAAYDYANFLKNVSGAQEEWIGETGGPSLFGKTLWQHLYSGVSGAVDNAARIGLYGGTGSLLAAGAQSASGSLQENAARDDMSGTAKLVQALLTGGAEIGTEKIGLDALFDKGQKNAFNYIKGVIASELGEETLNYLTDDVIDGAVAFLFDHEADIKSAPEFWQGLGETAISTLISSGLMGGGGAIAQNTTTRSTGKAIRQNGDVDALLDIAKTMPEGSESNTLAKKILQHVEKGQAITNYELGKLTQALESEVGQEYADAINQVQDEAIVERLEELGDDTATAKKNAPIIRKLARGQVLTNSDKNAVAWNDNATQVVQEMTRETKAEDTQRTGNKWVSDMKARQIAADSGKYAALRMAETMPPVGKAASDAVKNSQDKVRKDKHGKITGKETDRTITYLAGDDVKKQGKILRFTKDEGGMKMVVQTGEKDTDTETVPLDSLTEAVGSGVAAIIDYVGAEQLHSISAEEASTMLNAYNITGGDAGRFIESYEKAYLEGYAGLDSQESILNPTVAKVANENGRREARADEIKRQERASAYKAVENPTAAWLGRVDSNAQVKGQGDVQGLEGVLESLTEVQRMTAEASIAFGKAVGLNVVLFESDADHIQDIQNGSFDEITHTVYLDVNAGAGSGMDVKTQKNNGTLGYAMMRTMSHELTHYLEVGSKEAYDKYALAVKNALKDQGQDFAQLMRDKMDTAIRNGHKLTMAGAAAEVIADASEYMLQDSKFTSNLDATVKGKIKSFIQNFAQKVKEIFQQLTGGHKESAALRELKDGVYHYMEGLQELWDAGFDEIMAKGTEELAAGDAEMVEGQEVKNSDRDHYDYSKTFEQQVNDWMNGKFPAQDTLLLGRTPEVFKQIGLSDLPLTMDQTHLDYAINGTKNADHQIGVALVKQLPKLLEKPLAIIESQTHPTDSVMAIVDATINGKYAMAAVRIDSNGKINGVPIDSNHMVSVQGRNNAISKLLYDAVQKETSGGTAVYYVDQKRGVSILKQTGLNISGVLNRGSLIHSIHDTASPVNKQLMEQTDTQQFRRWFKGSKVVNEDGTPKVMYHGSNADFTAFDKRKAKAGVFGKGFYFTPNERVARMYGSAHVLETYVSIKNPYVVNDSMGFVGADYRYMQSEFGTAERITDQNVSKVLREQGYDGVMVYDADGSLKEIVAFAPTQIKSATDNVGTFDAENPDIRYSERDMPESVSIRELLESAGDDAASTIEEKNALQIYRDKLNVYHNATTEVEAAETALKAVRSMAEDAEREGTSDTKSKGAIKAEWIPKIEKAERRLETARVKQRQAYNKLVAIEETPHVQSVFGWARQFLTESMAGTPEEIEARQAETDKVLAELEKQYEDLKAAGRTQAASESKRRAEQYRRMAKAFRSDAAVELKAAKAEFMERQKENTARRHQSAKNKQIEKRIIRMVKYLDNLIRNETDQKNIPEGFKPVVEAMMRLFINAEGIQVWGSIDSEKGAAAVTRACLIYEQLKETDGEDLNQMADAYDADVSETLKDLAIQLDKLNEDSGLSGLERLKFKESVLQNIDDIVQSIYHLAQTIDNVRINEQNASLTKTASGIRAQLEKKQNHKQLAGKAGEIITPIKNAIGYGNMTPVYFFRKLGLKSLSDLANDLFAGETKYGILFNKVKADLRGILAKHNYWAWRDDAPMTLETDQAKAAVEVAEGGKKKKEAQETHTITISKSEAMVLWAVWNREHTGDALIQTQHLEKGGFVFGEMRVNGIWAENETTPHKLTKQDMKKIETYLTKEQKAFADEIVAYMTNLGATLGNETSLELFGIKKFKDGYYFPIQVAKGQLAQKSDAGKGATDDSRIKHMPSSRRRLNKAAKPIVVGDFLDIATQHMEQMLRYHCFAIPIENMNRVLNMAYIDDTDSRRTIREMIGQKYGVEAQRYLERYIADLNGGIKSDSVEKGLAKFVSLFKKGAVAASLSVAIQQPTSIIRATMEIHPKYFIPFMGKEANVNIGEEWEQLTQYSGVAVLKELGGIDMTKSQGMAKVLAGNLEDDFKWYQKLKLAFGMGAPKGQGAEAAWRQWENAFGFLAGKADQLAWTWMWRASKAETHDLHPEMDVNSQEFLELAAHRFDEVMRLTQVYDSTLARSQNMRSDTQFMKMMTSFAAEGTLTANMLADAFSGKSKGRKAKAAVVFVTSSIVTAAAAALVKAGRDDDDEKTWEEKYLDSMGNNLGGWSGSLNPLSTLPVVRDMMSLLDGYDIERSDMSLLTDLVKEAQKLVDGKYEDNPVKGVENISGVLANMFGVPAKNILRDLRSLYNTATGLLNPPRETNKMVIKNDALENFTYNLVFQPDTSTEAYYKKLYDATVKGEEQLQEDLKEYLGILGKDDKAIKTGVRKVVKAKFLDGDLTEEQAKKILLDNGWADDEKKAFTYVDEWRESIGNEDDEAYNHSVYNTVYEAALKEDNAGVKTAVDELVKNGWEEKKVRGQLRTHINEQYMDGAITQTQVKSIYKKYCLPDDFDKDDSNEWYWLFKKLDYGKANGGSTEGWSNYNDLKAAFATGNKSKIWDAWRELAAHGYKEDTVTSYVRTNIIKQMLLDGDITTAQATSMLRTYASYEKDSDNVEKPKEWLKDKK